ncbi:glycosyltransferase family 4 protein [Tenacibaculum sp. UWU-22]|uniref:glycosyltransferase family 4 protein n=1 Tax=Tenacibaculum sp. UWU-22 TaxID=3234187 RepID=UPI0034DAE261
MQKLLVIGCVWLEKTTGAGNRMLQLIDVFKQYNYTVTFVTTAQKTENSLNLIELEIQERLIELNSASFDSFVKELQPNIVLFDRFITEEQFGWRVAENCPNSLRILDTEDLHFLRKIRHQQLKKQESLSNKVLLKSNEAKREIAAILRCDMSLIISTYEMQLLNSVFKIDSALLYQMPFLLDKINKKVIESWKPFEERQHFVFVGNFLHKPNVDAVLQLKLIWKQIKKQLPKVKLYVYGAYATQSIKQLHNSKEGFIIKGFVNDALEVVENARVVLAPIRFGAGIKGKLTEAMVCGTPSVVTSIGAEGMCENLPWNGFVEDDFTVFANKAVELYSYKTIWKEAQQKGVQLVNQLYDREKLIPAFMSRVDEIQKSIEKHRIQNFLGGLLQYQTLQATKYMSKWIEAKNSVSK